MRERLRQLRERAGLSARELSALARLKSPNHVSHLEGGLWNASTATASALADALGCTLDWLVNGSGEPPTEEQIATSVQAARERRGSTSDAKGAA